MKIYDQRREDPSGFNLSIAAICGLVAIGGLVAGGIGGFAVLMFAGTLGGYFFYTAMGDG
jgi:hypothetical protein